MSRPEKARASPARSSTGTPSPRDLIAEGGVDRCGVVLVQAREVGAGDDVEAPAALVHVGERKEHSQVVGGIELTVTAVLVPGDVAVRGVVRGQTRTHPRLVGELGHELDVSEADVRPDQLDHRRDVRTPGRHPAHRLGAVAELDGHA